MEKSELIVTIVNKGNSDLVIESAKAAGARGGTLFNARGTTTKEMQNFFGLPFLPEKEMIFIVVDQKIKDNVLLAIYKAAGLDTKGVGIVFSLPIENVLGIVKKS